MSTPTPDATSSRNTLRDLTTGSAGTLILLLLVFICYAWSAQSGYIWDDDAYVTGNPTLRNFAGLSRIWTEPGSTPQYYPMTFTSFWLEVQLFGFRPQLSHIFNAALHAMSVLLLWNILKRLAVPGAWVAAALFAVHPIQVESVAWISERKNTLSLVLALSSLWTYLRYARIGLQDEPQPVGEGINVPLPDDPTRLYRLFLVLFVLALLAKTTVSVLPAVILVLIWWQRGRVTGKDVLPLLPAFALGAIGGAVTSYLEHSPFYVGATGLEWQVPLVQRVMLAGQTIAFYAYKIIWPFPIGYSFTQHAAQWPPFPFSFNYPKWSLDSSNVLQWLPLAGVVAALAVLFALRRSIGRGAVAAVAIFVLGVLPASGIVIAFPMRFSWVADHFAYLGSVGLIVGIAALAARLFGRLPALAAPLTGLLLAALLAVSIWHSTAFKNLPTLWARTLQSNPRSWIAAVNYGNYARDQAKKDYVGLLRNGADEKEAAARRDEWRKAARLWFQQGIEWNPNAYEAYTSRGILDAEEGKLDAALASYQKAAELADQQEVEGYRWPAFLIGELLAAQGKQDQAIAIFEQLEQLEPRLARRSGGLFAQIRVKHGDILRSRIKSPIKPDMPEADRNLLVDAMDQYRQATDVGPEFVPAKTKLASILIEIDRDNDALQQLNEALRVDPYSTEAKLLTAVIASKQGQYDAAGAQLKNLLRIEPNHLPARLELAKVFLATGQARTAMDVLRDTLKIYPDAQVAKDMLADIEKQAATQPSATQAVK
jgi:tetratricopeptide (TPR) repeat protein